MTRSADLRAARRTVLIAGASNIVVAALKLAAGIAAGSSALLAESAHSLADTINQGLLLAPLRLGERPGDRRHQFGHGQDRYFWSLLSAFGIFIAGAGFSVFEGLLSLRRADELVELLTMHLGPDHLIVGARLAFSDGTGADDVETLADRIDSRLADRLPVMPHVFLDPTQRSTTG